MRSKGYWTSQELDEVMEIAMGRDAGYIPEGCEDWMVEDGVPRAYDKRAGASTLCAGVRAEARHAPPRPAEPAELLARAQARKASLEMVTWPPPDIEDRLKTIETTSDRPVPAPEGPGGAGHRPLGLSFYA